MSLKPPRPGGADRALRVRGRRPNRDDRHRPRMSMKWNRSPPVCASRHAARHAACHATCHTARGPWNGPSPIPPRARDRHSQRRPRPMPPCRLRIQKGRASALPTRTPRRTAPLSRQALPAALFGRPRCNILEGDGTPNLLARENSLLMPPDKHSDVARSGVGVRRHCLATGSRFRFRGSNLAFNVVRPRRSDTRLLFSWRKRRGAMVGAVYVVKRKPHLRLLNMSRTGDSGFLDKAVFFGSCRRLQPLSRHQMARDNEEAGPIIMGHGPSTSLLHIF